MNLPRFHKTVLVFIAVLTPVFGFSPEARPQPPSTPGEGPSEAKKPPAPRVRPQVIYHIPRASGNAAALHAQAKAENNALPVDTNMPTSLQMPRSAANGEQSSPTPRQNRVVPRGGHHSRQKVQKGNSRSIAPRQATRSRGGSGKGKKQKK